MVPQKLRQGRETAGSRFSCRVKSTVSWKPMNGVNADFILPFPTLVDRRNNNRFKLVSGYLGRGRELRCFMTVGQAGGGV